MREATATQEDSTYNFRKQSPAQVGNTSVGAKAGAASGVVFGIILAVLTYISLAQLKSTVINSIASSLPTNSSITATQAYNIALYAGSVLAVIVGIILGVILGAIYGALFNRLPGKTDLAKALALGIIFWLFDGVLLGLDNLTYGVVYFTEHVIETLLVALVFSYLLATFYKRFSPPVEATGQTAATT